MPFTRGDVAMWRSLPSRVTFAAEPSTVSFAISIPVPAWSTTSVIPFRSGLRVSTTLPLIDRFG